MNYTQDIAPLESAGLTDSQIADTLKASGVTHRAIDRAELVHQLNMRGMLRKIVSNNDNEKWTGTVLAMQEAILALPDTEESLRFKDGIRLWFSHITNVTNIKWDTTQPEFAAPYWMMVQVFADQPTMPTMEDFEFIASLGGGWKFADATAEQVGELRTQHQFASRVINATALFAERIKPGDDPAVVMALAWEDAT